MQLPVAASGETIEMEELFELYPDVFSKAYENEILLNHLEKLGRIALDASGSQVVVKFMPLEKKNSTQHNTSLWNMSLTTSPRASKEKSTEITEVDRSLATIKRTEKLLNDEVENLQKEMDALEQKARSCLRDGSRPAVRDINIIQSSFFFFCTVPYFVCYLIFIGKGSTVSAQAATVSFR